ncbi:MAG TPA: hypothetical protein VG870_10380, partial [Chitinophagaceae bacterium]|nr:hypothetical protein [Chitinophagaceae bacterium]
GMLYGGMSQEQQFLRVISCAPRPVDAGRCNDRLFINGAGIGFEGAVAHSLAGRRKLPGKTSFLLAVLRRILFYRSRYYQIRTPEESWEGRLLMISVGNGQRAGGGFRVTPAAQIDDGLLDMICVDPLMPLSRIRYLPVIEKGRHLGLPFVHALRTTELWIRSDGPIPVHLDGELYSSRELHLEILPGRFQFLY